LYRGGNNTVIYYFASHRLRFVRIPKTACTTVLASLGWDVLQGANPHQYGGKLTVKVDGSDEWPILAVFRDPYSRAISAYLDRVVRPDPEWEPTTRAIQTICEAEGLAAGCEITFRHFVKYLHSHRDEDELDIHWRSQSSFLGGESPSIVLQTEHLDQQWAAHPVLKDVKIRSYLDHSTDSAIEFVGSAVDVSAGELLQFMERKGAFPSKSSFRSKRLQKLIRRRFARDYELWAGSNAPASMADRILSFIGRPRS
jgi:hypothetical protein